MTDIRTRLIRRAAESWERTRHSSFVEAKATDVVDAILDELMEPDEQVKAAMYLAYEKAPELMWRAGITAIKDGA